MADPHRYPINVFFSEDDEGFIAIAPDLPGCSAFGSTREEAVKEAQDAIDAWIEAAKKANNPIPEPIPSQAETLPSGKVLLRLPRTVHAAAIARASFEHVSLNQYLVAVITASTAHKQIIESAKPTTVVGSTAESSPYVVMKIATPQVGNVVTHTHSRWLTITTSGGLAKRLSGVQEFLPGASDWTSRDTVTED